MKYQVEATFSYSGYTEVEAESAQEAVDYVREEGNSSSVHDCCDGEAEIINVYDRDGLPIREEWT